MTMCVTPDKKRTRQGIVVVLMLLVLLALMPNTSAQGLKDATLPQESESSADESAPQDQELGLIDDLAYESPQFGNRVTWVEPWVADLQSMETSPDRSLDRLSIVTDTTRFQAFFIAADGETAADYTDRFITYREDQDPSIEIFDRGARRGVEWIAYTYEEQGDLVYDLVEIRLVDDDTIIQVVEVIGWPEEFAESFEEAMSGVEIAGQAPFVLVEGWPEHDGFGAAMAISARILRHD